MASVENIEDAKRKKLIATVLTVGSIILLSGLSVTQIISLFGSNTYSGVPIYIIPILLLIQIIFFIFIRRGWVLMVSILLITTYLLGTIYGAYMWGISMPTTLLLFSLLIGITGILISTRTAFYLGISVCIIIYLLGIREIHNPEITSWKQSFIQTADIIMYIVVIAISGGLSLLSNREIEKSLKRARNSEENLEQKVEQRTLELKKSQIQTLSEISKTAELGRLAQGLFHDLITPLTSVSLYMDQYADQNTKTYIKKAIDATNRMRRMIEVTKSQIKNSGDQEYFSVFEEVGLIKDLLEYKARKSNTSIIINCIEDITLLGISARFGQVIFNIAQNAIEAMKKDGLIEITIKSPIITISNNGPEIENVDQIFESTYTTKKDHFGIGLSTVKHIVEEFESTIQVTSDKNLTTFTITIPNAKIYSPFSTRI